MGPKKKLSGCQFKNIRKEKQKEDKKLASALGGWLLNENKEMGKKDTPSQIQEEVKEEDIKNNEGEEEECSMIPLSEEGDDDDNRSYITPTIPMDVDTNLATLEEDCGPQLEPFTKNERLRAAVEEEEGCSCTPTNEGKEIEIIYDDPKQWPENFRSDAIQNEVIEILGKKVRSEILQDIKNAKYFSIMFDCTPDTARLEQMSQIIRYVKIVDGECVIEESFVDFIISHQKTGRGLSEEILDKLMNDGLDIQNCRGQGFDNGANMAGKYEGVQAHICQLNDLAKFIPCSAHSLNLVGVHAAEVSVLMMNFFGKVLEFFNFFSSSTIRWEALLDCVKTTLKRHCETRWSSRRQAVTALQKNLPSVFKVLQNMADRSNNWNSDTTCGATNLLRQIDFEFVCLLEIWTDVLISLDCTNKSLQGKTVTLDVASSLLSGLAKQIQHLREQGVQKYIDNAKLICTSMSIDSSFAEKRLRRVKKMSGEMAEDEAHLISSEKIFERECYSVFDKLMSEMDNRSHIYHNISSDFSFLSGKSLSRNSVCDLQKCAADLGVKYSRDIDTFELVNEVAAFKFQAKELVKDLEKASHLDLLKAISKYELKDAYPNVEISLRIFLTMPVSVASCERSFSKLKIIKNYLRSSMCETRLTNLAILSIEYDRASKIDFNEVINEFALVKARKVQLL
ncbi:52 kDa repressor of the inhibitor of the protein kinase-like [Macrosteles quadrilineatus]|uniref:52 kDa repressor of the inhibitor of the protein kinase-like n=2 Tax=Macrosteles quadrilineatus TaxID=74068 RepID=UPI0023E28A24|nr:52 kDa repressor of the inhibitor of the protein kinase-like [Macrosteles quadrilineatus]